MEFAALIESAGAAPVGISGFIAAGLEATNLIERNAERAAGLIGNFKRWLSTRPVPDDGSSTSPVIGEMLSTLRPPCAARQ